jgi:Zn-dependent metalloprotease
MLRTRLSSSAGQVAAEYMGGLLLVAVVIAALLGGQVHTKIAVEAERAICKITGSLACGEPGVPKPEGADDSEPGEPDREVHDAECDNDLPGDLLRDEGDDPAGGDPEADQVYDNLGQVFDYYSETFGRDSYDDSGGELIASINFCETPGTPMTNAYWNGTQMVFGDGYASSLDITAHELTHAVTEETAGLEYQCQSGALNESMSDIFASNVDDDDWEIGEDLPGDPLRDMENPANGHPPQPAHVDDFNEMPNDGNPYNDHGGVHYNSGIPNHAYYLMVKAIGRDAAEAIVYRALTEELGPDSGFEDFRTASLAVAERLWGVDSPEYRGTNESFAAVGLDGTWEAPEVEGC